MMVEFENLKGKILSSIEINEDRDRIIFTASDGARYLMHHGQDCCETVSIESIVGDVNDLLNAPVLDAEAVTNSETPRPHHDYVESFTWTFYKLATIKGGVTIRWLGESNGYYSESVDFDEYDGPL